VTNYFCGQTKVAAVATEFGITYGVGVTGTLTVTKAQIQASPSLLASVGPNLPAGQLRLMVDAHSQHFVQHD
jgi:hypothetical protein